MLALLLFAAASAAEPSLGIVEMNVPCAEPARAPFLRGLAALHSFWYDEARGSFRAAVEADSKCHIARWGAAMTHFQPIWGNVDVEKARGWLAPIPPDVGSALERGFIDAARLLFGEGDKGRRERAWADAHEKLHAAHPDEPEAAAFHALALLATSGPIMGRSGPTDPENDRRRDRAGKIALALLELKPKHPGAAHYAIHAYDDPLHATLALDAARRYASIAPASSHALHMPAHIFVQLGMWKEAAASNEAAWTASQSESYGHGGHARHDLHSLEWLVYCRLQLGETERARELLDTVGRRAQTGPPPMKNLHVRLAAAYVIETRRWDQARPLLQAPVEALLLNLMKDSELPTAAAGALALGLADPGHAAELASKLAAARDRSGAVAGSAHWLEAETARLTLEAIADKEPWAKLDEALRTETRLGLIAGPASPPKPVGELYGEKLLAAKRFEEAAAKFAYELERHPGRRLSIEGLAAAKAAR